MTRKKDAVRSEDNAVYAVEQTQEERENDIINEAIGILQRRLAARRDPEGVGVAVNAPSEARKLVMLKIAAKEHEVFGALWLTNRHELIQCEELFTGTIDGASVFPREVVKAALRANAAAVIFFHNHPSGVVEPSRADTTITERLKRALETVDIRVLDHFIVGEGEPYSFACHGLL